MSREIILPLPIFFSQEVMIERLRWLWVQNAWVCCPSAERASQSGVDGIQISSSSGPRDIHLQFHDVLGKSSL